MKIRISLLIFACLIFLIPTIHSNAIAKSKPTFNEFIKQIKAEAIARGIRPEIVDEAFKGIKAPNRKVLHLDRTQPEKRLTYLKYRNTRADRYRIILGRREYKKHHKILDKIGNEYGVSPCFILSLWGLESSYGRFMGSFPVIKSLATLAYDNRRSDFFRKQLFLALEILNGGHVTMEKFKGEWAGASGHPQFLPSSWHNFAVDYDHDGRKDIWTTLPDVFASIANYLVENGWQRGQPWAMQVKLPKHFNEDLLTREVTKTVHEWEKMGVKPVDRPFPNPNTPASIVYPYGGPAMMIFNNFKVFMRWNRSIYYAGTVGYMAEEICKRPL